MAEQPVTVSATFVDEWAVDDSAPYYALADDTKTIAAMLSEANALLSALQAVSDAHITRGNVTFSLPAPAPTGVATAGSRVEQVTLLGFAATGTNKRWSGKVPAISNTEMTGDRLTLAAGPVAALIAILTTVGTVLKWCNAHSQQIDAFIDAITAFHKKRKQLQRSSFEV